MSQHLPVRSDAHKSQAHGVNRRQFLRLSSMALGATALAACVAPTAPSSAGEDAQPAAQPAALSYLSGGWFIPELVEYFDTFATAWAAENNVEFAIDVVTQDANARLATAVETGEGVNLAQIDYAPTTLLNALVDISDIAETLIAQQGDYYRPAEYQCFIDGSWYAVPFGQHPRMFNYREDWFAEVGYDSFPGTWDEVLEAGTQLKANGHPYGWTMSEQSPADGPASCLSLLWSFGGREFHEDGSLALDSQETLDALNFAIQLYNDACDPASTSYQEASNNQAFLGGQISMTYNVNSIYIPALENAPEIAEAMNHSGPPAGPGGAYGYTGVAEMIILNHTEGADLDAARQFMLDFYDISTYGEFLKLGRGYLIPASAGFDDQDVWPEDPKLQAVREMGDTGQLYGFELSSPTELASAIQTQVTIPKMFSVACTDGDAQAALDAALTEIADIEAQLA